MENIALTLREVADQVNREAREKKIALIREFVETKIFPYLQEMANKGKYSADLIIPGFYCSSVYEQLRSLGFTTEIGRYSSCGTGRYITVKW